MKKLFRKVLFILFFTCVGLLLVEVGVRLVLDPPMYWGSLQLDREFGFRMKAGSEKQHNDEFGEYIYQINSEGFRSPEFPITARTRPDGRNRLVFVGDSFLNAFAVREDRLITQQTRQRILARGRPTEVYSLCSDAYGTAQELLLLRRFGSHLAPDAVVLVFFPSNDVMNNSPEFAGFNPGDYLRPYLLPDAAGVLQPRFIHPNRALGRRLSRTFAFLERGLISLGLLEPFPSVQRLHCGQRARLGLAPTLEMEIFLREGRPSDWNKAWVTTEALIRAFRDEVQALGSRFLVLVIPSCYQVQLDARLVEIDWEVHRATGKGLGDAMDWNRPELRLMEFFSKENIEARYLVEPLRAAAAPDMSNLYVQDGHLSWRGHDIAAASVTAWFLNEVNGNGIDRNVASTPGPVPVIPPPEKTPSHLDFRKACHDVYLTRGWLFWNREPFGPGWVIGESAALMLPFQPGTLVIRGVVPPELPLPAEIRFIPAGWPEHRAVVDKAGPFEVRYPKPFPLDSSSKGYTPLYIKCSEYFWKVPHVSLVIQEIAFEAH